MINRCWRWWVNSCHPLILLVVAYLSTVPLVMKCLCLCHPIVTFSYCSASLSLYLHVGACTPNPGEKMNCRACLIVKSGCRFPWQHLCRLLVGFRVMGRQDFFIQTFFFSFPSSFGIFEGGNSDGGRFTEWQCDRCSSIFQDECADDAAREDQRELFEKPSSSDGGTESRLSCSLQFQPFLLIFLLTPLLP